jgi:hypothetical protein
VEPSRTINAHDDDAPDWPLHQRLSGVVARTLAVGLAVVPAVALLNRRAQDAGMILALVLAFVFPMLAVERRDVGLPSALLRHLIGAVIGVALVPVVLVSLQHAGDPMGAYAQLGHMLDGGMLLGLLLFAPFASVPFALLAAVRVRTARLGPQLAAGLLIPALLLSSWLEARFSMRSRWIFLLLLSGALVPLALVGAERLVARRDPRAPRPIERDPRPCFAALGLLLLLASLSPTLMVRLMSRGFHGPADDGQLIDQRVASQLGMAGADRTLDGVSELTDGRLVRLFVADEGRRWCIAADPVDPARRFEGSWVIDHTNALRRYEAPVAIDADALAAPSVGKAP